RRTYRAKGSTPSNAVARRGRFAERPGRRRRPERPDLSTGSPRCRNRADRLVGAADLWTDSRPHHLSKDLRLALEYHSVARAKRLHGYGRAQVHFADSLRHIVRRTVLPDQLDA